MLDKTVEVTASRWWGLFSGSVTRFLFPVHLSADHLAINLTRVKFWLTPWMKSEEELPMNGLAEVTYKRGLIWDSISLESNGGINPLSAGGLPKGAGHRFVEQVRIWDKERQRDCE